MALYEGEMNPKLIASGTQVNTGTTVTLSPPKDIEIGRTYKPVFAVKILSGTIAISGTITFTYQEKIYDFIANGSKTATVTLTGITGQYTGATAVTSDFSTFRILSFTNNTDGTITGYELYLTGIVK